ncbi:MAG: hypothetical protein IPH35_18320 [Rhodoferax sp.]|nr:hypothetical protein [Rhodoferax sp.]
MLFTRPANALLTKLPYAFLWHDFLYISDDEISKDFAMPEMQQERDGAIFH